MKASIRGAVLLLSLLMVGGMSFAQAGPGQTPAGVPADWWSQVQANIQAEEYHVAWQEAADGRPAGYAAPNRAQGFRTAFSEAGIKVEPMRDDGPAWRWGLALVGPGTEKATERPGIHVADGRIEFDRGWITEWYINSPEGLEQGFTVHEPLEKSETRNDRSETGARNLSRFTSRVALALDLQLTGNLHPRFSDDGQAVDFWDGGNVAVLRYAKLKVTDATGRELPARFEGWAGSPNSELRAPNGAGGIRIAIDAEGAAYPLTVDPLATSAGWTATGEAAGDNFGYSVATAGDVNGDGYADIIVGAPAFSGSAGKAYLFMGSPAGLSGAATWTGTGQNAGDRLGCRVATAGDVNGDGYSDVLIGAEGFNSSAGKVHLLLGGPAGLTGTPAAPAWSATGEAASDSFGTSLSTAGDVNGDGYSDVVVGAYAYSSEAGRVYLYLGGALGLSTSATWTATGGAAGNRFGNCVATAGDVNGDGYSDVAVGAAWIGMCYLYLGGPSGLGGAPSWTAAGENPFDGFGWAVATAGDVNGDGYADLAVGATEYGGQAGKVYLYFGRATGLSSAAAWTVVGEGVSSLGCSLASAGDVNGDGYADLIVGAYAYDYHTGRAYVYLGSATGLTAPAAWSATGVSSPDRFGYSVATAGDVNGDGYSDVVAGALSFSAGVSTGKAYLYHGGPAGLSTAAAWSPVGEAASDAFGISVSTAGDVNGDGYADVVVGAYGHNGGAGKAYLYRGAASGLSTTPSWMVAGEAAGDNFGVSVGTAGDVNGDGYADVFVGALGHNSGTGKAYLYLGGAAGLAPAAAWTAAGENAFDLFGIFAAAAGDVNGDGYADVAVSGLRYGDDAGKVYLYSGGPAGLSSTASWTATGEATNINFGHALGTAGDVNGDGFADLVVGAASYGGSAGKACVFLGGPSGLSDTASWTVIGEVPGDRYGFSAGSVGDVNGDGYSDLLVGAPERDGSTGKAYLYLGGVSGLAPAPAWTAVGETPGDQCGFSCGTAGDVNGDGYSDLVVGAYGYSSNAGKAYLYLGGVSGPTTTAAWTAVGEGPGDLLAGGYSGPAAGDVNGDGYSDIVVSASGYDGDTGKVYLYYGNRGAGAATRPRQLRSDLSVPIAPGGNAYQQKLRLGLTLRSPMGKAWRKMQWQITPWGGTFAPSVLPIQSDATWYANPVDRTVPVTLSEDLQRYTWRVRMKYHPAKSPFLLWGPWFTLSANGLYETDVFSTSSAPPPACVVPDEPCWLYSVVKNGTDYTLNWQDPNQADQRTGWNVRRSNDAGLPKATWPLVATNVADMDAGTANNQWTDHSGADPSPSPIWYYQVSAYNSSCPAEGPF